MEGKKKYITLYYVSVLSLILALIFFVLFLLHKRVIAYLVLFLAFLLGYLILSRVCNKELQCEEGCSLIQAIHFYQTCKQAGYRGTNKQRDVAVLAGVAERFDFLDHSDPNRLKSCYDIGRQAEKGVTNPAIRSLWTLRGKTAKRGGKKNV